MYCILFMFSKKRKKKEQYDELLNLDFFKAEMRQVSFGVPLDR